MEEDEAAMKADEDSPTKPVKKNKIKKREKKHHKSKTHGVKQPRQRPPPSHQQPPQRALPTLKNIYPSWLPSEKHS